MWPYRVLPKDNNLLHHLSHRHLSFHIAVLFYQMTPQNAGTVDYVSIIKTDVALVREFVKLRLSLSC